MQKSKRVELVMNAIKQSSYSFEVLDEKNDVPVHVRVTVGDKVIDVWPATGTFGAKGKYVRNNVQAFINAIGADVGVNAKTNSQRITELEEYCAHLEHEISLIKERI